MLSLLLSAVHFLARAPRSVPGQDRSSPFASVHQAVIPVPHIPAMYAELKPLRSTIGAEAMELGIPRNSQDFPKKIQGKSKEFLGYLDCISPIRELKTFTK